MRTGAAAIVLTLLAGCINLRLPNLLPDASPSRPSTPSGTPVGAPAGTVPAGAQPAAPSTAGRPDDSSLKPFRDVIAGASESEGYFTIWQKYDRVWIEIPADRLDRPFFFSYNVSESVGERRVYASQMGKPYVVVFHRVGNAMQLVARNSAFVAAAGSPAERAVRQSFTDSLLASAPVLSQPHPQRGSVLIDATALLLTDIPGYSTTLESAFRINYALDRANSSFVVARTSADGASFSVRTHFSTARLPPSGAPGMAASPPTTPPDARSVFVGFVYNFAPLPEPMRPRLADDRVGFHTTVVADYTTDTERTPRRYYVERWRLEKRDAAAALSEPKRPITFWIDRNVPVAYRAVVEEGILAWNAAFERIGFRNAIVAEVQPDDADFDTLDARHASVRWFLGRDAGYAIGPTHTDPRTGEILDADIAIPDAFTRSARSLVTETLPSGTRARDGGDPSSRCEYAHEAVNEAAFALGLLDARGDAPIDGADADRFARDYLRALVTHEVGHALGLRHNFRASTIRNESQLQDAAFTRTHGLSGSVMDYSPFNLSMRGERQGEYVMSGLGPYDYWAIEYAYKPIDAADADGERPELARIAARSVEPDLAYASDEDAGNGGEAIDPDINRFDLGNDPLAYYRKRFALSRELWERLQSRAMKPDESYLVLRRNLERGFEEIAYTAPLLAKYVGGVRTSRHHAGAVGAGRVPPADVLYVPVDANRQRQALDLLATRIFSVDSFRFEPAFLARLGIDYLDRGEPGADYQDTFNLPGRVLSIQTTVLDQLMSDSVARRIGNAENLSSRRDGLLSLAQLYETLQRSIWDELRTGRPLTAMRRNLQREHLRRMVGTLLRTSAPALADARSLQRENAIALRAAMRRALMAKTLSIEDRAHLREGVATLDDALRANLTRTGV